MMTSKNKHAYLLLTHEYTHVLETLIRMIDDERNDIYVHIDKKVKKSYAETLKGLVRKSELHFVKRHKVYWGHISLVKAEYELFLAAYSHRGYCRFHLVSGNDLPISSQDVIHGFFDAHQNDEFISFTTNELKERVLYRWLFTRHLRGLCSSRRWIGRKINKLQEFLVRSYVDMQKKLNIENKTFSCYRTGSEWVSLTDGAVEVLLQYKKKALRAFRYSNCPDEHYKHTILFDYNNNVKGTSNLRLRFYQSINPKRDEMFQVPPFACILDSARYIPWGRGSLDLTIKDYDEIIDSGAMFCRKVVDEALTEKLYERCCKNS